MRLLIVDDDAGLRQSLALLLGESGYLVEAESDPERALKRASAEEFDLILCDVRMPKMDGLTFLRRYRADEGEALLIMMSAYGSEDAAIAAMREGAYDYLQKPFRPDEVMITLRKAAEREKLRREVEELRSSLGAGGALRPSGRDQARSPRESHAGGPRGPDPPSVARQRSRAPERRGAGGGARQRRHARCQGFSDRQR